MKTIIYVLLIIVLHLYEILGDSSRKLFGFESCRSKLRRRNGECGTNGKPKCNGCAGFACPGLDSTSSGSTAKDIKGYCQAKCSKDYTIALYKIQEDKNDCFPCGEENSEVLCDETSPPEFSKVQKCKPGFKFYLRSRYKTCVQPSNAWPNPNSYLFQDNNGCPLSARGSKVALSTETRKCENCGGAEEIPCTNHNVNNNGCDPRTTLVKQKNKCVICGELGQYLCQNDYKDNNGCKQANITGNPKTSKCENCGELNQIPCLKQFPHDQGCNLGKYLVNAANVCIECGTSKHGFPCSRDWKGYIKNGCRQGYRRSSDTCVSCGKQNEIACIDAIELNKKISDDGKCFKPFVFDPKSTSCLPCGLENFNPCPDKKCTKIYDHDSELYTHFKINRQTQLCEKCGIEDKEPCDETSLEVQGCTRENLGINKNTNKCENCQKFKGPVCQTSGKCYVDYTMPDENNLCSIRCGNHKQIPCSGDKLSSDTKVTDGCNTFKRKFTTKKGQTEICHSCGEEKQPACLEQKEEGPFGFGVNFLLFVSTRKKGLAAF